MARLVPVGVDAPDPTQLVQDMERFAAILANLGVTRFMVLYEDPTTGNGIAWNSNIDSPAFEIGLVSTVFRAMTEDR